MVIDKVEQKDYKELIEVWESSVRATHHFLKEEDLQELKPLILNQYFDAVELKCVKDDKSEIVGFSGVLDGNLEMLFISAKSRFIGLGSLLVHHAINNQQVNKVDVNEQNKEALGFYEHMGFHVVGRSELDGQGKPYPLLHLILKEDKKLSSSF